MGDRGILVLPFGGVVGNDSLWPKGGHVGANGYTGGQFYCQVAFGKTFPPYPPFLLPRVPRGKY